MRENETNDATTTTTTTTATTTRDSTTTNSRRILTCRICHGHDNLIRACECRGTCANVHVGCLQMWVTHRQTSGMSTTEATMCELCLTPFSHRLERSHIGKFLISRGAWRAWAHLAYLAFCARRVWSAGSGMIDAVAGCGHRLGEGLWLSATTATATTGLGMSRFQSRSGVGGGGRNTWGRIRTTGMLALHYWLLLVLDARLLLGVFRRWRDMNTRIVVCGREDEDERVGVGGDEPLSVEEDEGDERTGDSTSVVTNV